MLDFYLNHILCGIKTILHLEGQIIIGNTSLVFMVG